MVSEKWMGRTSQNNLPSYTSLKLVIYSLSQTVHRCGLGGSMRACHAAGPGSFPGRGKFPGWFFRGFSLPVRQMSGSFRTPRSPNIIWPSFSSSIIIHYGRHWPEMLTRPKTSNIHTYLPQTNMNRMMLVSWFSWTVNLLCNIDLCQWEGSIFDVSFLQFRSPAN